MWPATDGRADGIERPPRCRYDNFGAMSRDENQRSLRVSKAVKAALVELRLLEQTIAQPVLDRDVIDALETSLECKLPDDLLATFAAQCDALRDLGIGFDRVAGHTAAAHAAGCPAELIAIGRTETPSFVCVARKGGDQIHEFDPEDKQVKRRALADWLADVVDQRKADLGTSDDDDADPEVADVEVAKADLESFKPRVVAPPPATGRRVRHAMFGVGDVLREIGTGAALKFEVRFPSGTKVLIARVVEDA
jgi:hypothetical protein